MLNSGQNGAWSEIVAFCVASNDPQLFGEWACL